MAARKQTTSPQVPEPVTINTICSVCGLSWHDHGKDPTTDDCIRLLKAELAKKPTVLPQPYPYPVPRRPYPWREPYWNEWYTTKRPGEITYATSTSKETSFGGQSYTEHTPKLLSTSCNAVASL